APAGKIKYPLNYKGENIIGRKARLNPPDVNVLMDSGDGTMSRRHARIHISFGTGGTVFLLSDLNSQNGTRLFNRQRQEIQILPGDEVYLQDGYIIRMGNSELIFEAVHRQSPAVPKGIK
ncbi:MAG TPA: FHA domain-containing protein, partial [Bacteroidetes bacterium]|nr:FHA domain-containing protein [Bacteroidota bacterium]